MRPLTNDPTRALRERHDRAAAAASEAYADLQAAQKKYGDEPSSAQQRALATLQAEYDRAAGEASGAERELKAALARADGAAAGPATGARRVAPELHSYGRGDDLRANLRADGPGIGQIVRALATGDSRALGEYSVLTSGVSGAVPGYATLGIVEAAMQESVIFQAGARVIPMDAPSVRLARVTSVPNVQLRPEAEDRELADQAPTFTTEQMDAFSAFLFCTTSLESLEDCANLEEVLLRTFARQLSLSFDRYGLAGTGNDQPLGLAYLFPQDGASTVDPTAKAVYAALVEAIGRVRSRHHTPSSIIMDVPGWTALQMLVDKNDQPLQAPPAVAELPMLVSDYLPAEPAGTRDAIVGDLSHLLIGIRTNMQLEVSRLGEGFKKGMVEIRGYLRWSNLVDDPSAICVVRGLEGADLSDDESPADESPSS